MNANDIIRIPNINNYTQEIIDNVLILIPIYNYISEEELLLKSLSNSIIINCIIKYNDDEIICNSPKSYFRVLIDIYKSLSASFILQNTTFNIKLTNENGNKGYIWCPEINMSVQRKETKGTLKEIIKMINVNNYKIDIQIKLINDEIINYKNF